MLRVLIALVFLAAPSFAQPLAPEPPADLAEVGRDIPLAEWRAKVEGRTVWYFMEDDLWGREYYHPGAGYVTFQYWTGECRQARWSYSDGAYCFDFRDEAPHCFRHLSYGDEIWVLPTNGGTAQAVVNIDATPLDCGPAPST